MPSNKTEKRGKKSKIMLLVKIIIIILIIHLILILSKCTITKEEFVTVEVPSIIGETIKEPVQNCVEKEFDWEYNWGGLYAEKDDLITAAFRLTNLEDKAGVFEVDFAFYDESKYHFKDYEGKLYESVKDELPWDAADMWFSDFKKNLDSRKSILITPSVEKKDPSAIYWVYANVKVPTYRKCTTESYITTTKNKTIIVEEDVKKNVTHTVSLWQLLIDKIFN